MNLKRPTMRYIIIQLSKARNKRRIFKSLKRIFKEKTNLVVYNRTPVRLSDFSAETFQARRE